MTSAPSTPARLGVGAILLVAATILWAITFAWMWIPYYVAHAQGQLYLYPIAMATEVVVLLVTLTALIFAIVETTRHRIRTREAILVVIGSVLMIGLGPILLWFGSIPAIAPSAFF